MSEEYMKKFNLPPYNQDSWGKNNQQQQPQQNFTREDGNFLIEAFRVGWKIGEIIFGK